MHIQLEKRGSWSSGGTGAGVVVVVIIVLIIVFGSMGASGKIKTSAGVPPAASTVVASSTVIRSDTVHSPVAEPSVPQECPPKYSQRSCAQENLPSYTESRVHTVLSYPERAFYRY